MPPSRKSSRLETDNRCLQTGDRGKQCHRWPLGGSRHMSTWLGLEDPLEGRHLARDGEGWTHGAWYLILGNACLGA